MAPRDTQRSAVYAWEQRLCGPFVATMSLDACRLLMLRAWRDSVPRGTRPPQIAYSPRLVYAYGGRDQIDLPRWAHNTPVVLHETAHAVVTYYSEAGGYELAGHGPEFVRVYADFLVRYAGVDAARLHRELVSVPRRVRIAGAEELPWRGAAAVPGRRGIERRAAATREGGR